MRTNNIANLDIGTHLIPIQPQKHSSPFEAPKVHTKLDRPSKKPNNSNRLLICALALVLLLLLGLIIHGHQNTSPARDDAKSPDDHLCAPSQEIPPIKSHLLRDDNSTTLAEVAGYVQLLDDELGAGYLPLNFHSIYRERLFNGPILVSLVGDCATFEITYHLYESKTEYEYNYFELHIRKAGGIRPQKRCDFQRFSNHDRIERQPIKSRYSCRRTKSRMCSRSRDNQQEPFKMRQQVAQLVLSSLQLEFDGDPLAVQRREFSKAAWPESCNI